MKLGLSRTRALLIGVTLIAVTNAVVLAGVAYNRSGEPTSALQFTERELPLRYWSWPSNDNSSIDLELRWRVAVEPNDVDYNDGRYGGLYWLSPAQLQQLGFEVSGEVESDEVARRLMRQPSRRAWLALEFDGPAHQAAVARTAKAVERAEAQARANPDDSEFQTRLKAALGAADAEQRFNSRLFVVDAARDKAALAERYADRQRYAIVRGRLSIGVMGQPGRKHLVAHVADIDVATIRVPHTYRALVEPLVRSREYGYSSREPRFATTVNFGRRAEPWIVDLTLLQ